MNRIILSLMAVSCVVTLPDYSLAKRMPPKPGSVEFFSSENGRYSVEIENLGYPDNSPSRCAFKEGNRLIWSKEIPFTPGKASISDNGKCIALANWGMYDEGGFKGLSFYDNKGKVAKEISFGNSGKSSMIWISQAAISPDGARYIFTENGRDKARLYLYDFASANLLWVKECGFAESAQIKVSSGPGVILAATFDYDTAGMLFVLLDARGAILWQKKIGNNFSPEIKNYFRLDAKGKNFAVFDKSAGRFIRFLNENGRVSRQ
ncbi:MAG: hypothetical protein V1869_06635 [Candidatus Omnitrophota bacterium]